MPTFRFPNEKDLLAARKTVLPSGGPARMPCPDRECWLDFVTGAYANDPGTTESLLAHLAECSQCGTSLNDIRSRRRLRRQTTVVLVALAASILCAIAVYLWFMHGNTSTVAVVDLRDIAATRGAEISTAPAVVTLPRSTSLLRVILPVGSGHGSYQLGLFQGADPPHQLLSAREDAIDASSRLEIRVRLDLTGLPAGRYLLGIRTDSANWDLYPINVR